MAAAQIQIRHLSKTFPGQRALDDVSLDIKEGRVHALVGMNGSGKSTLIKVLSGFHRPDPGGTVTVAGNDLSFGDAGSSRALGLRVVHQSAGIIPQMSALENLAIPSNFIRRGGGTIDWPAQRRECKRRLAELGVTIDVDRPMDGMRAIDRAAVAIARALDADPSQIRLLVLDEPTAAFSPTEVKSLHRIIRRLTALGVAVLYVSHHISEILDLADEVSVLYNGVLRETVDRRNLDKQRLIAMITGETVAAQKTDDSRRSRRTSDASAALTVRSLTSPTLRSISFSVGRGEILGFAGLSGSGRDDLARALAGREGAAATLTGLDGRERELSAGASQALGIVLALGNRQNGSYVSEFSLRENITLGDLRPYTRGALLDRRRESTAVARWIDTLGIYPKLPEVSLSTFSGGNQQKAILARALAVRPSVLILDDPTAGVDVGARRAIYRALRGSLPPDTAVIICSSDFDDFTHLCDRVLVFSKGTITAEFWADEINEANLLAGVLGQDERY